MGPEEYWLATALNVLLVLVPISDPGVINMSPIKGKVTLALKDSFGRRSETVSE